MSDTAQGIRTAQEYIKEYCLLEGSDSTDKILNVNPQTGEVTGWDAAQIRYNEFSAAMKQIYTAGTGGARADLATMQNAFEGTAHQFDIAIKKLEFRDDIELEGIAEYALKQAEELLSRYIDFKKLCNEYLNEFEAMLGYLKEHLDDSLSRLRHEYPAFARVEKRIGKKMHVPVNASDFPVFAQVHDDINTTSANMQLTKTRVGQIKTLAIHALNGGSAEDTTGLSADTSLLFKAVQSILAYEIDGGSPESLAAICSEIQRYLSFHDETAAISQY